MSHFVTLVLGDNAGELLAPFDENLEVEPYEVVLADKDVKRMREYYVEHGKLEANDESLESLVPLVKDWDGCPGHINAEGKLCRMSTYNPKSQWDWYQVGGRWSNMLLLRNGKSADSAEIGEIDIVKMQENSVAEAKARWAKAEPYLDGYKSWDIVEAETKEKYPNLEPKELMDAVRAIYHGQTGLSDYRKAHPEEFFVDFDQYSVGKEVYLETAKYNAIGCFAVLDQDGNWHQKGKMGWFGCSTSEMSELEWRKTVMRLLEQAGDSVTLTVYDLHI